MTTSSESSSQSPRLGLAPALVLALAAGYVDAFAFLHYRVYASFMSGNTTQTGVSAGLGNFTDTLWCLTPIPSFVAGVFLGTMALTAGMSPRVLLLAVGGLLTASPLLFEWPMLTVIALSVAMGAMNTTITRVGGQAISLGYVSGGLNHLGQHLALALRGRGLDDPDHAGDTHARRALLLFALWSAFLIGAGLAAYANSLGRIVALVPAIVLVVGTAAVLRASPRNA